MKKIIFSTLIMLSISTLSCARTPASHQIGRLFFAAGGMMAGVLLGPIGMFIGGTSGDLFYQQYLARKNKKERKFMTKYSKLSQYPPFDNKLKLSIYFGVGSHELTESSRSVLNKVLTVLKQNPNFKLTVIGAADPTGKQNHYNNQALSIRRATVVESYLVHQDILPNRLTVKGIGPIEEVNPEKYSLARTSELTLHIK